MTKAIIIDDEAHCIQMLSFLLNKYCPEVQIMDTCKNAETGLNAIEKYKPDIVFLDIEMPRMNGFEMLEKLSEIQFAVIFTTGYNEYAVRAIHSYALDYLLKPVDPKELMNAVKKAEAQSHSPAAEQLQLLLQQINGTHTGFNKIAVPTSEGYQLVPSDQVLYLEANDNYTHLFLKNKVKIIVCRTLKEMEFQIQDFSFFVRVHNSYMVNLNEVVKYVRGEGGYLVMSDDSMVNVSRSRKDALLKYF